MDLQRESTPRVLVIDDSTECRRLVRYQLEHENVEVVEAGDGGSGVRLAFDDPPDLILLDLQMPGPGGFETIRRLKDDARTRSVPVIFFSAFATTELKAKGLDLGAVDFISKPIDAVELRARVRAALRSKSFQDLLEHRAHIDGLTGLGNRLALEERLIEEWWTCLRRGAPLAVLIADMDHFKQINDRHGHATGDTILRATAESFREVVRAGDFVARFGGEEFVAIAPDCELEGALAIAERFRALVAEIQVASRGQLLAVSTSVGVAVASAETLFEVYPRELLRRADEALYQAKAAGRNAVRTWEQVVARIA